MKNVVSVHISLIYIISKYVLIFIYTFHVWAVSRYVSKHRSNVFKEVCRVKLGLITVSPIYNQ